MNARDAVDPADHMPLREIRDPRALRALAHPARIRILEELALGGAATATELAERVGESAANCSWHLRQLSRYGFVEEAGGGTGRQRPWRIIARRHSFDVVADEPETTVAGDALAQMLFGREFEKFQRWHSAAAAEPPEWRNAPMAIQSLGWLTAEELEQVKQEILAVLMRYAPRFTDESARPAGSRPIRFVAWGIPATPPSPPLPDETGGE